MIDIRVVSKSYGKTKALDRVSIQVPDGAVTGLVGPNGAGKSTLLRIASKLAAPDAGSVLIDGQDIASWERPGSALGVFLSAEWIPANLTAASYLKYICQLQGVSLNAVPQILESVGLGDVAGKRIKGFSLGMRQRLGIGAAIATKPRNYILDEPINGLDPDAILWLRQFVRSAAQRGEAVLLSSHHMSELALVVDHVVMVDEGQVIRSGPVSQFIAAQTQRTYLESDDLAGALRILAHHGFTCEIKGAGAVVHDCEPREIGGLLFREGPGVTNLQRLNRTIEETYFEAIAGRQVLQGRA